MMILYKYFSVEILQYIATSIVGQSLLCNDYMSAFPVVLVKFEFCRYMNYLI